MKLLFLGLTLFTSCTYQAPPQETVSAARIAAARAHERQLEDNYRPPGRFQLVTHTNKLIKLDTVTGETWQYEEASVATIAVREGRICATGWLPIQDLTDSIHDIENLRPAIHPTNSAHGTFDDLIPTSTPSTTP